MFKVAVLGPLATSGGGVARECVACYRASERHGAWTCPGFGPGCLGLKPKETAAASPAAEREMPTRRWSSRWR